MPPLSESSGCHVLPMVLRAPWPIFLTPAVMGRVQCQRSFEFLASFIDGHIAIVNVVGDLYVAKIEVRIHTIEAHCFVTLSTLVLISVDMLDVNNFVSLQSDSNVIRMIAVRSAVVPRICHY